jgi:hypothetical protein
MTTADLRGLFQARDHRDAFLGIPSSASSLHTRFDSVILRADRGW